MKLKNYRIHRALALAALVAAAFTGLAQAAPFDPSLPTAKPAQEFKFDTIMPTLKFSDAYGDRANTAHGRFAVIAGKWATPSHTHSAAYHGVVIRGVVTNGFDGAPRHFVWNPTVRITGRSRARWACGQAAFEPVHMSTGQQPGALI